MTTQQDYKDLTAKIEKIVGDHRVYVIDENVDRENALDDGAVVDGSPEFWTRMILSVRFSACERAEEGGVSPAKLKKINALC